MKLAWFDGVYTALVDSGVEKYWVFCAQQSSGMIEFAAYYYTSHVSYIGWWVIGWIQKGHLNTYKGW